MSPACPSSPPAGPFYDACSYPLDDSVGAQLANLMLMLRRELDFRMTAHGLTDAQWKPLWLLLSGRATTANELARCSHIDAGAMTRTLDRLEAKSLIERVRSDTDRRVVQLRLTAAGEQSAQEVPQVLASVNNDFLRGFSTDEWQQLRSFLERMTANGQTLRPTEELAP